MASTYCRSSRSNPYSKYLVSVKSPSESAAAEVSSSLSSSAVRRLLISSSDGPFVMILKRGGADQEIQRTRRRVEVWVWTTPITLPCNDLCRPQVKKFRWNADTEGGKLLFMSCCLSESLGILLGKERAW